MSKYIYSVMDKAGDIVDEMQFDSYQDCIRNLQDELVLDVEEIIDGEVYCYGRTNDNSSFAPMDDWGNHFGATSIEYLNNDVWEEL